MAKKRKTLRDRLHKRLNKQVERAVAIGAITAGEGVEVMRGAKVGSWMLILQLIMMIVEIIGEFLDERE